MNFISKKWFKKSFSYKTKALNDIYPKKDNEFVVPYHERRGDYYVNPCLSQFKDELEF